jgi:hypothetical protein
LLESVRNASLVATPEFVRRLLAPLAAVGSGSVWTSVPEGVYSSRKTAVAALESGAVPSPTRTTARLPPVSCASSRGASRRVNAVSGRRDRTRSDGFMVGMLGSEVGP